MIDGIDVAYPQGLINWNKVVSESNISFACAKVSQGLTGVDSQFHNNWKGIKDNGIIRGGYHFANTGNDPAAEANHFLNTIGQVTIEDFLALDIEVSNLQGSPFVKWVLTWLETVEQKTGKIPFIYTGGPFFNQAVGKLDALSIEKLKKYPLWLAAYVTNPDKFVPVVWKEVGWTIWQKAGDVAAPGDSPLHVPGISNVVDHDVFNGTVDDLKKLILNLHTSASNDASAAASMIANSGTANV